MNHNLTTRIIFIIDRSGSMASMQSEAMGGFNGFVDEQLKEEGQATLSLVIFDNVVDIIHDDIPLNKVPVLTNEIYMPRGMTALYDAIGVTINKYRNYSKVDKTILAILTDGAENSSKEYTGPQVKELITAVESGLNWEVLFLGANINVQELAGQLNLATNKFATFDGNGEGCSRAFATVSAASTMYRKGIDSDTVNLANEYAKTLDLINSTNSKS